MPSDNTRNLLSEPERLIALNQCVRAKVPVSDVQDVVQSTLACALSATTPPFEPAEFDRWLFGIARHKIADFYRRNRRHEVVDSDAVELNATAEANPESARDLLRWANDELPKEAEASRTLEWMLREASGDCLETIAQEHELSAPVVRQRVSRLRRYLRERWAMQLAAALGMLVVITGLYAYRQGRTKPAIAPEVVQMEPSPVEQARLIREAALTACRAGQWQNCLTALERAKTLDPVGDSVNEVRQARESASRALAPPPPVLAPTSSAKRVPPPEVPQKHNVQKVPLSPKYDNKSFSKGF